MLRRLLAELAGVDGPVDPGHLARRLRVDRSAVEGMLGEAVRLGLLEADRTADPAECGGASGACGGRCDPTDCPLVARLPVVLRIR
ncbi:MAG TPA: MarR family transcriptional regulator [Acidimicrobiales bacterium]|nr:MarR family transcriptional regulator [Acidimicrobiales bacterium]